MFMTRFAINTARRGAQKLLGSPRAMHAAVESGFPPTSDAAPGRALWRVDVAGARQWLYVVSPDRPDLTHLVEQAGWPTSIDPWQTRSYSGFLEAVAEGQQWGFRLRANPVKQLRDQRARVPHVTADQQREWLIERSSSLGFRIPDAAERTPAVTVSDRQRRSFRRESATVTLVTAQFDGVLVVQDPDILRRTLCQGVGRGKAYGCGLLTLGQA